MALLIIALERNVAHLGEACLVERGHRLLDRRANLVGTGVIGRKTELLDLGDESGVPDDLCKGLSQQIEPILRRARRNHHQSAQAGNADFTAIMAYALGLKSKIITGYKGTGDMNLAIQRGEVDGRIVSEESAALYGPSNGMRVVAVLARKRVEQFPAAPTLFEAAELGPTQARLIDWRAGIAGLGRLMMVTPGTPQDRLDLLRQTFAEVIRDPGFIAEVKKLGLSANHAGADEVRATIEQAMTTLDPEGLAEVRNVALERYYQ